jgi:Flp pilus assembly protein TadG
MKKLDDFLKNEVGVSAIFFAAFLPIVFGFAAFGVDASRGINTKNFLERSAKITCDLIR